MTIFPQNLLTQRGRNVWQWLEDRLWLLLPLFALGALWPFYAEGLPRSYDGALHLLRISMLDHQIDQGMIYPRWTPELMIGHGYPVFSFYGPATYYLVVLLHWAGLSFVTAFMAAFGLQIVAAGAGMYCLARDIFGPQRRWAILVAAVAYLYTPYLLTNVYIRGALAEAAAQALLPWIFWSGRRLLGGQARLIKPERYLLPFALSLSGLALTHNITLLFLPPVLLGFLLIHWQRLGRPLAGLGRVVAGLLLGMGISAFFWIPLIGERTYLTDAPYEIAKQVWLPISVWTWDNFLDQSFTYTYSFARPVRLGLVQLMLALAGFMLARRHLADWWFWGLVAIVAGLGIGAWTLPLWQSSNILIIAQFPWRLLSIISLPLALFTGGLLLPQTGRSQPLWALLIIALSVVAHQPRLQWMKIFPAATTDLSTPVFVQTEMDKGAESGGEGNSSVQEFRPRWVGTTLELDPRSVGTVATPISLTLTHANAYALHGVLSTSQATTLRWQNFYFPGWQATLNPNPLLTSPHLGEELLVPTRSSSPLPEQGREGSVQERLQPYPSTNLGLLTVNLPAGQHQVQINWVGTALQDWAGLISLGSLALLAGILWWLTGQRRIMFLPLLLLLFGFYARYQQPPLQAVAQPSTPVAQHGLQLLGYRWEEQADRLLLYPYWYITQPPPTQLRVRWHLQDRAGQRYSTLATLPYFNTYRASNFPVGTIVDDAYQLPLPPGLAAGEYDLAVELVTSPEAAPPSPTVIGQWSLATAIPPQRPPRNPLQIDFGKMLRLGGYDMMIGNRRLPISKSSPAVVYNGDYLWYQLYWRASGEIDQNYHGLIHLLDHRGEPLVKQDQLPGPIFHPPLLWDRYRWQPDRYLLRIPNDAPSGLYWPVVGAYEFETVKLLPITSATTQAPIALDYYRLPPFKLVNRQPPRPQQTANIRLGDWGALTGFTITPAAGRIQAGQAVTVTLFYRADQPVHVDLTRFLHLASPSQGMAAQQDSQPQAGANPTWSWQAGEIVVDSVVLQTQAAAPVGTYTLFVGFYDPQTEGTRLVLSQADGTPVLDNRAPFSEIVID